MCKLIFITFICVLFISVVVIIYRVFERKRIEKQELNKLDLVQYVHKENCDEAFEHKFKDDKFKLIIMGRKQYYKTLKNYKPKK